MRSLLQSANVLSNGGSVAHVSTEELPLDIRRTCFVARRTSARIETVRRWGRGGSINRVIGGRQGSETCPGGGRRESKKRVVGGRRGPNKRVIKSC